MARHVSHAVLVLPLTFILVTPAPAMAQLGISLEEAQAAFQFTTTKPRTVSYGGHPSLKGKDVQIVYARLGLLAHPGVQEPVSKLYFVDGRLAGFQPANPHLFIKRFARSLKQVTDGRQVTLRFKKAPTLTRGFPTLTKTSAANWFNPINTRVGDLVTVYSDGSRSSSDYSVTTGVERIQFQYLNGYSWAVQVDSTCSCVAVAEYNTSGEVATSSLGGSNRSVSTTARKVLIAIPDLFWAISVYKTLSDTGRHNELLEQNEVPDEQRAWFRANRIGALFAGYVDALQLTHEESLALGHHTVSYARRRGLKLESLPQVMCSHLAFQLDRIGHSPAGQRRMRILADFGGKDSLPSLVNLRRRTNRKTKSLASDLLRSVAERHQLPAPPSNDSSGVAWKSWVDAVLPEAGE